MTCPTEQKFTPKNSLLPVNLNGVTHSCVHVLEIYMYCGSQMIFIVVLHAL